MAGKKKQEGKTDMQAMTEVYKKLGSPGTPHKLMARRVGSWSTKMKHWMEPDKPPMESTGDCEREMLLGGRFLKEEFTGDMMGSLFTCLGFTGYDNHTQKYMMAWMDSMSTGIYLFEGTASADGKTIRMIGSFEDPVKGPVKWRSVTKIVDDDTEVFEMYVTDKNGREEKSEITYRRKK